MADATFYAERMSLRTSDAIAHGADAAFILAHFEHFIRGHMATGRNEHDGRTWNYNTAEALAEQLPFLSAHAIRRRIARLVETGVLVTGHWGGKMDRTLWYAFADEVARFGRGAGPASHFAESQDATGDPADLQLAEPQDATGGTAGCLYNSEPPAHQVHRPNPHDAHAERAGEDGHQDGQQDRPPPAPAPQPAPAPPGGKGNGSARAKKARARAAAAFPPDSRPYQAATWLMRHLADANVPHVVSLEALREAGRESELQAWAATFDKVHRLDGATWEDVAAVLHWLVKVDDWWVPRGNFQTAHKLRQKDRQGVLWHRVFLGRARAAATQPVKGQPADPGLFDRMRARAATATPSDA